MTQPSHHPSTDLIVDHARGALDAGRALVLEAHISTCPGCRASLRLAEAVGGALLAEIEPTGMAPGALDQALAALDHLSPLPAAPAPKRHPGWIAVPDDVLIAAERRKRWAAPGVWVAEVTRDRRTGARSYLLGVGRNIAIPQHTHRGEELVCVLKGAYRDGDQLHGPGDFAWNDESVEHRPKVTAEGECVCLIAADNALLPRSLAALLLQPFVRI